MLAATVALHDVNDTEAFVQATINKARLILTRDERDELVSAGIEIMVKLARDYRPHIEGLGHDGEGRFSGYAAMYLPRKLSDAWHRINPHHQLVTHNCETAGCADPDSPHHNPDCDQDGKRRWHYRDRAVSIDALTAEDPDRHQLMASSSQSSSDLAARLRTALWERAEREIEMTVEIGELLGEGATAADVAQIKGLTAQQVRSYMEAIGKVASALQSEDS